ncbi:DUF6529 family protein [Streptomyces sp. SID13031]|uniref:DUF6529 family protein n=1 Tax=Streptomyces sp. SID13031 TaxID=2706046 RepID=UPI0013C569AE|nr:DUF6529 family protein [Streptomyces sp. SID13031]NEA34923.1 hypothetical protein [Streptomyces sp. SID13031]
MSTDVVAPPGKQSAGRGVLLLLGFAVAGALVAVALGFYGKAHTPTGRPLALIVGFTNLTPMKAWLATAAVVLVIFQVVSALWMYGRLPVKRKAPAVLSQLHRWSGAVAFVATLPVAYHCLWSLGFSTFDTRTALHSLFGCAFYGAFTTKMLALRANKMPSWALPISGGLLFALLIGAWATAAVWYFAQSGVPLR